MRIVCLGLIAAALPSWLLAQQPAPLPPSTTVKQEPTAWRDPAPHRMRFVTVDKGMRLEVLDWGGTGRPLVLLSGLWNTAHIFDDFALKLTPKYHVYGITRRGFGASSVPATGYTADRLGDDVLAVLDSLKIERPVLVGHSIAGEELSSVGTRHPERVAGLIYLDAAGSDAYYDTVHGDFQLDLNELQKNLEQLQTAPDTTLLTNLLQTELPRFERELRQYQKDWLAVPFAGPLSKPPTPADSASFPAYRAWWKRVRGLDVPEAELRQQYEARPGGRVGPLRPKRPIARAIFEGEQKYGDIHVPILAIYADPEDDDAALNNLDPAARAAYEAIDSAQTETQAEAFEKGVTSAHVVRLPHANHYVFLSNEKDVLGEMNAFLSSLPR